MGNWALLGWRATSPAQGLENQVKEAGWKVKINSIFMDLELRNNDTQAATNISSTQYSPLTGTRVSWRSGWSGAGKIQDESGS